MVLELVVVDVVPVPLDVELEDEPDDDIPVLLDVELLAAPPVPVDELFPVPPPVPPTPRSYV